ncbi:uncharacterized conserved protein DUF2156 [Aspergillus terreus]|uniref:Uncharacterized conserved protein DUF2156 n=1 Tax=Aspergillus terreus TaxID=33178 RepID=A0A5M3Z2P7_ASPTE|nr:hypothetical protein ATETN484_0008024000 [Aspergillus terreus]GFF21141.1 uncharacterized conserved protein DUF2156 [Aspergillus terreus]
MELKTTPNMAKNVKKNLLCTQIGESLAEQLERTCACVAGVAGECQKSRLACVIHIHQAARSNSDVSEGSSSSNNSEQTVAWSYPCIDTHFPSTTCRPGLVDSEFPPPAHLIQYTPRGRKPRSKLTVPIFDDPDSLNIVGQLARQYGHVSHMGILDRSYIFFLNKARTAALAYKVQNQVAIVSGQPLCPPEMFTEVLDEFNRFRKSFGWSVVFMGADDDFAGYACRRRWTTMKFGVERVINATDNDLLMERTGKRLITQNRQLLSPSKGGITLGIYVPSQQEDPGLEKDLQDLYDAWRTQRNETNTTLQPFITVYNLFDFASLMVFIYSRRPDGRLNGLAALRWMGAQQGYHLDPCIAAPGAPKGISDLLAFAAMSLLKQLNVSYLSLGYEPLQTLGEVNGIALPFERIARAVYNHSVQHLPVGGKKAYHDKFRPDPDLESGLYMVFPFGVPGPRQVVAIAHMANIRIRKLAAIQRKSVMQSH